MSVLDRMEKLASAIGQAFAEGEIDAMVSWAISQHRRASIELVHHFCAGRRSHGELGFVHVRPNGRGRSLFLSRGELATAQLVMNWATGSEPGISVPLEEEGSPE